MAIADLYEFVTTIQDEQNQRESDVRAASSQLVGSEVAALRAEVASLHTPLTDAHVFGAAAVSVRADLTTLQAEFAAATNRREGLTQAAQMLAQWAAAG